MQIYPFSQLRNKGFSLFQSCFYKSGMLPLALSFELAYFHVTK